MKIRKKILSILLAMILLLAGCSGGDFSDKSSDDPIVIGSKDFTESIIVSELYAQALETGGYKVERKQALGATPILHQGMLSGDIDIIGEYTSTGLAMVLKTEPEFEPDKAYNKVKEGYENEFNLIWLEPSKVNNSQGLAVTKEVSEKYSFTNISQLPEFAPNLRLCSTPEFEERDDGLKGLRDKLGSIEFKDIRVYDKGLKYEILRQNEADMNVCFTTDAELSVGDIIALEDDINFWPPYNLTPVVRKEVLESSPEIETILNEVSSHLDTSTMQKLNAKADLDGEEYSKIAQQALKEWGIIA